MNEYAGGFGSDLKLLSDLLNPTRNDDSSDDEHVTKKSTNNYMTPADIAKAQVQDSASEKKTVKFEEPAAIRKSPYDKLPPANETEAEKLCLDDDEFLQKVDELTNPNSWKKTPKWEVVYRQSVSASDVYLQMGNKTPSTSSCENMMMKILLPGETRQSIDLKVQETELELNSAKFYLKIPLPQPVNPQLGDAKFDNDTDSLMVKLVMDRELDFVNF